MSRAEIVFAIQMEFKGGTGEIKSFSENYYTLYKLITINNRYNCCEKNNFYRPQFKNFAALYV